MVKKRSGAAESSQASGAARLPFCTSNFVRLSTSNRQIPQVEFLQAAENKAQKIF